MIAKRELFMKTKLNAFKYSVKADCYLKNVQMSYREAIVTDWEEML